MAKRIRAVVMTAPGHVEVQELPYPDLEKGALIIKMDLSGICGTDKHAFKGETLLYAGTEAEQQIVFPTVHGHENVGTVVEIHPEDSRSVEYHQQELKPGDQVTMCPNIICKRCWYCRHIFAYPFCAHNKTIGLSFPSNQYPYVAGGWAEYMYVPPGTWVYKIPEQMTTKLAVLTELFVVTATLDRAKEFSRLEGRGFGFADTVVIQGVGAVGIMHVAKAKLLGAGTIIAVDESKYKLALAKEFGADYAINVSETTANERVKKVKDVTDGRGADVVVECVGSPNVLPEGLEMLRRGGTYIETGNFVETGSVPIDVHRHIAAKNVLIVGNSNHPHTGYYQAMKMMEKYSNAFPFEKLITHVYRLEEADAAMKKSFEPDCLKVVFAP